MSEELKLRECPFCGCDNCAIFRDGRRTRFMCDNCAVSTDWYDSEAEAIAAWNTRTTRELSDDEILKLWKHYAGEVTAPFHFARAIIAAQRG